MRESKNSSRSWRVGLSVNFLARLRNKVTKKADEFFVNHFFGEAEQPAAAAAAPPTHAAAQRQPCTTPHGQFDYGEASGMPEPGMVLAQATVFSRTQSTKLGNNFKLVMVC